MSAELRSISWDGPEDLATYVPDDHECFSMAITIAVGLKESGGADLFTLEVCTPSALAASLGAGVGRARWGRHTLFVNRYSYPTIRSIIEKAVAFSTGESWNKIALKLGRFAAWEFEDYRP